MAWNDLVDAFAGFEGNVDSHSKFEIGLRRVGKKIQLSKRCELPVRLFIVVHESAPGPWRGADAVVRQAMPSVQFPAEGSVFDYRLDADAVFVPWAASVPAFQWDPAGQGPPKGQTSPPPPDP